MNLSLILIFILHDTMLKRFLIFLFLLFFAILAKVLFICFNSSNLDLLFIFTSFKDNIPFIGKFETRNLLFIGGMVSLLGVTFLDLFLPQIFTMQGQGSSHSLSGDRKEEMLSFEIRVKKSFQRVRQIIYITIYIYYHKRLKKSAFLIMKKKKFLILNVSFISILISIFILP